jgi:hypothetical protein
MIERHALLALKIVSLAGLVYDEPVFDINEQMQPAALGNRITTL